MGEQTPSGKQELGRANLTSSQASNAFQKMAVLKARRGAEEAEVKLRAVKKWWQSFGTRATPLLRQLAPMFALVGQQLPKGAYWLRVAIKALHAYTGNLLRRWLPHRVDC